jgi:hypothetical protein
MSVFVLKITDLSLEKLIQASRTLRVLMIKGCPKLTNEGIKSLTFFGFVEF